MSYIVKFVSYSIEHLSENHAIYFEWLSFQLKCSYVDYSNEFHPNLTFAINLDHFAFSLTYSICHYHQMNVNEEYHIMADHEPNIDVVNSIIELEILRCVALPLLILVLLFLRHLEVIERDGLFHNCLNEITIRIKPDTCYGIREHVNCTFIYTIKKS